MFELILAAIKTNNVNLVNILLSAYPKECWFDIDGAGNSVAHYCAAFGIVAQGDYLSEAMKYNEPNKLGHTPAKLADLRKRYGEQFDLTKYGLQNLAIKSWLQTVSDEQNTTSFPKKLFYKNIEKIVITGEVTPGQLEMLANCCISAKEDEKLQLELVEIYLRYLLLSDNYQTAAELIKEFPEQDVLADNYKTLLLFINFLLSSLKVKISAENSATLCRFLPPYTDNVALGLILLSYASPQQILEENFGMIEETLDAISQQCELLCLQYKNQWLEKKHLVDVLNKIKMLSDIFIKLQRHHAAVVLANAALNEAGLIALVHFQSFNNKLMEMASALELILYADDFYVSHRERLLLDRKKIVHETTTTLAELKERKKTIDAIVFDNESTLPRPVWFPEDLDEFYICKRPMMIDWLRFDDVTINNLTALAVIFAIKQNDVVMLRKLLPLMDEDFISSGIGGSSLFHLAGAEGKREGMEYLVESKPDLAKAALVKLDKRSRSPFLHAFMSHDQSLLAFFKDKGLDDKSTLTAEECAVSEGDLEKLKELEKTAPLNRTNVLGLLQRAMEAKRLDVFSYLLPYVDVKQLARNASDILGRINYCFASTLVITIRELSKVLSTDGDINLLQLYIYEAATSGFVEMTLELIGKYNDRQQIQKIIVPTCCKIMLVKKMTDNQKAFFIEKILKKNYHQLDVENLVSEFEKFDQQHQLKLRLNDILALVSQFYAKYELLPKGARCQAELAVLIAACMDSKPLNIKMAKRVKQEISAVPEENRYYLMENMLLRLHDALRFCSRDQSRYSAMPALVKLAGELISQAPGHVSDDNRRLFSNCAFAVGDYRKALDLMVASADDPLLKLVNIINRVILLFFIECQIQLPENVKKFYLSHLEIIGDEYFVNEVALVNFPSDLNFSRIKQLKAELEKIAKEVDKIKFSKSQSSLPVRTAKHFGYVLDLIRQLLKQFNNIILAQFVDKPLAEISLPAVSEVLSKKTIDKLEEMKSSFAVASDALKIFSGVVKLTTKEYTKFRLTLKAENFTVKDLSDEVQIGGQLIGGEIIKRRFPEDVPSTGTDADKVNQGEKEKKEQEKKEQEKKEQQRKEQEKKEHEKKEQEKIEQEKKEQERKEQQRKEQEKKEQQRKAALQKKEQEKIEQEKLAEEKKKARQQLKREKKLAKKEAKKLAQEQEDASAADEAKVVPKDLSRLEPVVSEQVKQIASVELAPTIAAAQSPHLNPNSALYTPIMQGSALDSPQIVQTPPQLLPKQPMFFHHAPVIFPPFNKIPPPIFSLFYFLDQIPTTEHFQPFENYPKVNSLLVGGAVRDCDLLPKLNGDFDFWTTLTGEQIMQYFPTAEKQGEGRSYKIKWYGFDVDLTPVRAENLNEKFEECDFVINKRGYHPLLPIIDKRVEHGPAQSVCIDHIKDEENIFMKHPVRILRAIRFMIKYNLPLSFRCSHELFSLKKEGLMSGLLISITDVKLSEEYRKLVLACNNNVSFAHERLKYWDLYDGFLQRKIFEPLVETKLQPQ